MNTVPLFKPMYGHSEKLAVASVLDSGWSGLGPTVERFEQAFAAYLNVKHAVMTSSCTTALHLALVLRGIGPGHRVAVPAMTFCSTAHVVKHVGAEPVLQDVCETDLLLHLDQRKETFDTVIPVLYAGQPCTDWERYTSNPIIYDCAHAVGSVFNARCKLCCWSFHAVKNLACGEGGMLTTDDDDLAARARRLRWMGISKGTHERMGTPNPSQQRSKGGYSWEYDVEEVGFKCHGNDLAAAVGLEQLKKLPAMQARRKVLWERYREELNIVEWLPGHSSLLAVLRHSRRDALMDHLRERGIQAGCHYKPLSLFLCYADQRGNCPVAEQVWTQLITLPLFAGMTDAQQGRVIEAVKEFEP